MRLYYRLVLGTGAGILAVHTVLGLLNQRPGPAGWFLLVLDALVLVVAYLGLELEREGSAPGRREPLAALPTVLGLLVVTLCYETGGLGSPYFLLVLSTCIFGALTLRPVVALLLVALVGAVYTVCAWVSPPEGFLRGGANAVFAAFRAGRKLEVEQMTTLVVNCAFLFVGSYVAMRMSKGYRANMKGLQESATRDPLTSLLNRRGFVQTMRGEIGRAQRYAWPIALLMIDLDHFKKINDQHGHPFGDAVLKTSAKLLREAAGTIDHLARVGGEEFSIAAMGADPNHGAELAQRVLRAFRNHDWNTLLPGLKVTCSIGVAILHPGQSGGEAESVLGRLMAEADRGLYMAKQEGRNTFRAAEASQPPKPAVTRHADLQTDRRTGSRILDDQKR
jgi:diguanylate cyclase (GGDEF)-like protein